jgi:hypothetical protein
MGRNGTFSKGSESLAQRSTTKYFGDGDGLACRRKLLIDWYLSYTSRRFPATSSPCASESRVAGKCLVIDRESHFPASHLLWPDGRCVHRAANHHGAHFPRLLLPNKVCARRAHNPCTFYKYAPIAQAEYRASDHLKNSGRPRQIEHWAPQLRCELSPRWRLNRPPDGERGAEQDRKTAYAVRDHGVNVSNTTRALNQNGGRWRMRSVPDSLYNSGVTALDIFSVLANPVRRRILELLL